MGRENNSSNSSNSSNSRKEGKDLPGKNSKNPKEVKNSELASEAIKEFGNLKELRNLKEVLFSKLKNFGDGLNSKILEEYRELVKDLFIQNAVLERLLIKQLEINKSSENLNNELFDMVELLQKRISGLQDNIKDFQNNIKDLEKDFKESNTEIPFYYFNKN